MSLLDDFITRVSGADEPEAPPQPALRIQMPAVQDDVAQAVSALQKPKGSATLDMAISRVGQMPPPAPDDNVSWGDHGNRIAGSVGQLGAMVAGAGEYGARQLAGTGETPMEQFGLDAAQGLGSARRGAQQWADEMFSRASPEAQHRAAREVLTLDPTRTMWQGGPSEFISSLGLKISGSLAPTAVPLLGYGLLARMGMGGVASSLYGVSEGALSMGGVAASIAQEVEQAPIEVLMESQKFQEILKQTGNEQAARQQFIGEVQGVIPIVAGMVVGGVAKVVGKNMDELFAVDAGAGLLRRGAVGYGSEFTQEFGQSGAEQYAQNVARQAYDAGFDRMSGVAEAATQGGLVGGPLGGGMAIAFGRGPQQAINTSPVAPDVALAASTPPPVPPPAPPRSPIQFPGQNEQLNIQGAGFGETTPPLQSDPYMGAEPLPEETEAVPPTAMDMELEGQLNIFDPYQPQLGAMPKPQLALGFENAAGAQRPGPGFQMMGPAGGQQSLGLRDRSTGLEPGAPIEPLPMAGAPVEEPGEQLLTSNPFQQDAFEQEQKTPGFYAPTAEPARDVLAQLEDLQSPKSRRKGVYLSKDNLNHLQKIGRLDLVTQSNGVPIRNFDKQGGLLIARDPETAEDLSHMRDSGAGTLEEVIGLATGAGSRKPLGSNMVVQKLDKQGNVIRERVVTAQERMHVMQEFGEGARTLSVPAVLQRRKDLIKQEQKERGEDIEKAKTAPSAPRRVREQFEGSWITEPSADDAAELASEPALDEDIGERLLRYAADTRREERKGRKSLPDVPAPGELKFRGREIADLERRRGEMEGEVVELQDTREDASVLQPRKKKLTPEQQTRLAEVDKQLEDARYRLQQARGKIAGDTQAAEGSSKTYAQLYGDLLDSAIAAEMEAGEGTEGSKFEADAKYQDQLKKLQDFIRAEGGYTRSEAIAAAATRFAPKARRRVLRAQPRKQVGSEIDKARDQRIGSRQWTEDDAPVTPRTSLATGIEEVGSTNPEALVDKRIQSFEHALKDVARSAEVSPLTAAARLRPTEGLTPRAQELVKKLFGFLSPTETRSLKGDESYAAVEVNALLRQWITAYRMALRDNMPADKNFNRRNWKMDVAAARLSEMIGRLRSEVRTGKTLADASQFVAQELYYLLRMAGRVGVSAEVNPLDFWKSVRKGVVPFRDYLRKHLTPESPDNFLDVTEESLKKLSPGDLNSLYVRAVETSTRERTSDGRRTEIVRQILEVHGPRFSNTPKNTVDADAKPELVKGAKNRYISQRSLFREHLNQMPKGELHNLYLNGSTVKIKEGRKTRIEKLPAVGSVLPAPMPENLLARRLPNSEKIKYILRAAVRAQSQQHGGASRSGGLTRKTTSLKPGYEYARTAKERGSRYNVDVLLKDIVPRDLPADQQAQYDATVEDARKNLSDVSASMLSVFDKLSRGKYQELAEETENGELTVAAKDMIYGRAYARWLHGYGRALLRAKLKSREGMAEMNLVARDLTRLSKLTPANFAVEMGARMRAESREQLLTFISGDRKNLVLLRTPEGRQKDTARNHEDAHTLIVQARRFDEVVEFSKDGENRKPDSWVQNERYQRHIAPILRKISDTLLRDGWPSYVPSNEEKALVEQQLAQWRRFKHTRDKFYRPLQQMLADAGFFDRDQALLKQYTPKHKQPKGAENFAHQPPQKTMVPSYDVDTGETRLTPTIETYTRGTNEQDRIDERRRQKILKQEVASPARIRRLTALQQVKATIERFKTLVARENARVQDIVDAERRMIDELEKLGAWKLVGGEKMQLGAIGLPTLDTDLKALDFDLQKLEAQQRKLRQAHGRDPGFIRALIRESGEEALPTPTDKYVSAEVELGEAIIEMSRRFREVQEEKSSLKIPRRVTYRRIGPRLRDGRITKEEARRVVKGLPEFKVPPLVLNRPKTEAEKQRAKLSEAPKSFSPATRGESEAAEVMANLIGGTEAGTTYGELLAAIQDKLPVGHPYQSVIARLLSLDAHHNTLVFSAEDWSRRVNAKASVEIGQKEPVVVFDQSYLRDAGEWPNASLHTAIHEMVHVATLGELGRSPELLAEWENLRRQTFDALRDHHNISNINYGEINALEFVAEVFTNRELQRLMAVTPVPKNTTLWQKVVELVRSLLGLEKEYESLLDAALALEPVTFGSTKYNVESGDKLAGTLGTDMRAKMQIFDPATRAQVQPLFDKIAENSRFARDIKEKSLMGGSSFLLKALSMRQIDQLYYKPFGGVAGPLRKYMDGFEQRNSDSSKMLEDADQVSRPWTKIEESDSKSAAALSRIIRDSTMLRIHPDQQFGVGGNEHLTQEQHGDWAALSAEWAALPQTAKDIYYSARDYYTEASKKQVRLMLLNALRASKFAGDTFTLTEADIDLEQESMSDWIEKQAGFDPKKSRAAINEAENDIEDQREKGTLEGQNLRNARARVRKMEDDLQNSKEEVALLTRIANLPKQVKGPYFPLMRFGEYAVRASRIVERRDFASASDRAEFMKDKQEEDPTAQFDFPEGAGFPVQVLDVEFQLAESVTEAKQRREEMVERYGEANVDPVQLKQQSLQAQPTITGNRALQTILRRLEGNAGAQAALREFYLQSLHDSSFRKREIKRKNIRGVDEGVAHRTFAAYAKSSAYYTAQLRHGHVMAEAKGEMIRLTKEHKDESEITAIRLGQVVKEIEKRDEQSADLKEVRPGVRKAVELGQFMLLLTPSYWMVNASQPYMITLPWLAGHVPVAEALRALTSAQGLIIHPLLKQAGKSWGGLKAYMDRVVAEESFSVMEQVIKQIRTSGRPDAEKLISMLEDLRRESIIDLSFIAELRDVAAGEGKSQWDRVMDASRVMAHLTEVNNRIMTAIAAYDIATQRGGEHMSHENAVNFAKRAVAETQFDYSASNKPRLFSANDAWWKPVVFQFMQYTQHMYFLMATNFRAATKGDKVAMRTLAGLFMTHLAAGGLVGASIQPIKWAIGLLMAMFGLGDDEDRSIKNVLAGQTYDRMIADVTSELFGDNKVTEMIRSGLPRGIGVDLSSRLELGRIYMVDLDPKTAETLFGSMLMSFSGPLTGIGAGAYEGAQLWAQGDYAKGLEKASPKLLRDAIRTYRFGTQGMTDYTGKVIMDADKMSPLSLFVQSMGFQPSEISETYAKAGAVQDAKYYIDERRAKIMRQYSKVQNADDLKDVMDEVQEFNRKYPREGLTVSELLQSRARFRTSEVRKQRYGADLSPREAYLAEEGEAYEE